MGKSRTPKSNRASFAFNEDVIIGPEMLRNGGGGTSLMRKYDSHDDLHQVDNSLVNNNSEEGGRSRSLSRATSSFREHYDTMKGLICGFLAATSAGITLDLIKVLLFYTDISEFELIYQRSLVACICVAGVLYFGGHSPFEIGKDVAIYALIRVLGSCFGFML